MESTFYGVPLSKLPLADVFYAAETGFWTDELQDKVLKEFTNDPQENVAVGAIKYDGGKAPVYRGFVAYFPRAMEGIASVSAFGATKYAWKGWENVDNGFDRYTDALVRHLAKEGKGEVLDPESRLLHAEHVAWNACARLELLKKEREGLKIGPQNPEKEENNDPRT